MLPKTNSENFSPKILHYILIINGIVAQKVQIKLKFKKITNFANINDVAGFIFKFDPQTRAASHSPFRIFVYAKSNAIAFEKNIFLISRIS